MIDIINSSVEDWWDTYTGEPFHALISDPPYHLQSIVNRFGSENAAPAKYGTDGVFSRASKGFMGKQWDGGDVAFRPETWAGIGKHLYPGAFGMVFSASRQWHRLAVALEDAGMIIHPTVFMFGWCRLSGFPKATNISKAIDRQNGKTGVVVGSASNGRGRSNIKNMERGYRPNPYSNGDDYNLTIPETDLARIWSGHRYGGQVLKPSIEPVIVFQKPYEGRPLDNIIDTGAGALNVDGTRISRPPWSWGTQTDITGGGYGSKKPSNGDVKDKNVVGNQGGWPSNLVLSHHPGCELVGYKDGNNYTINRFEDGAKPFGGGAGHEFESDKVGRGYSPVYRCHPDCPVASFDNQVGVRKTGNMDSITKGGKAKVYGEYKSMRGVVHGGEYNASSLFHQSDWSMDILENLSSDCGLVYCPKVSGAEGDAGLDGENQHPTLKPIKLIRYLSTMLLPPKEYAPRRILVPFSGSGSELIGCYFAGWEHICGVEMEQEYCDISKKRVDFWRSFGYKEKFNLIEKETENDGRLSLF